jgi:hypothetical protein
MRFKPPPNSNPHGHTGWRVEFCTMELQVSDFENAALVAFLVLLSRAILAFDLDMLVPISRVDENMKRAQMRGACLNQKFFFKSTSLSTKYFLNRLVDNLFLVIMDAKVRARLKNNSQKGYILNCSNHEFFRMSLLYNNSRK